MKLSVFLSAVAVMFASLFWGCSDLSVSKQEALDVELPDDFDWKKYASINRDVPASQIAFDVQKRLTAYSEFETDSLNERIKDCMNILEDLDFAGKIYLEYAHCPKVGWNQNAACTGAYANNSNYVKGNNDNTCYIGSCWSGGWDEEFDCGPDGCAGLGINDPFRQELQTKIDNYKTSPGSFRPTSEKEIWIMCWFILPRPKNVEDAQNYLESFYSFSNPDSPVFGPSFDSTLVRQHYFLIGRSEGRPYKYCEAGAYDPDKVRNESLALRFEDGNRRVFFDYGQNLFCLNECEDKTKCDDKIYLVKEK